jgi:hypothetical protein
MFMMLLYRVKSKKSNSEATSILGATAMKKCIEINENINKWTKTKFMQIASECNLNLLAKF